MSLGTVPLLAQPMRPLQTLTHSLQYRIVHQALFNIKIQRPDERHLNAGLVRQNQTDRIRQTESDRQNQTEKP